MDTFYDSSGWVGSTIKKGATLYFRKPNYFFWTIFLLLQFAVVLGIWLACLFVFNYPEKKFSYKVLDYLNRLKTLKTFKTYTCPRGSILDAEKLYNKFYEDNKQKILVINTLMKRNYINNYKKPIIEPVYVKGKYRIQQVKKLQTNDAFYPGLVLRMQSLNFREVIVEYILPGNNLNINNFEPGNEFRISGRYDKAVVLNAQIMPNYYLCLSIISLTYRDVKNHKKIPLRVVSPKKINIDARWPITTDALGFIDE